MLITRALEAAGGVQKRAAELLQVKPTTFNEMIKRYGIGSRRRRNSGSTTAVRKTKASGKATLPEAAGASTDARTSDFISVVGKRFREW